MAPTSTSVICTWVLVGIVLAPLSTEALFGFTSKRNDDDLYAVLGVPRHASQDAIKKAFRHRARDVHPDLKEGAEEKEKAKDEMARVLRAYDILSDAVKKDTYDRFGVVAGENGVPSNAGGDGSGQQQYPGAGFPGGNPWGNFYQQGQRSAEPIKSKTTSLASVHAYERLRMRTTREPMVVLVQAYHDACFECRLVSTAWENLANSGFAYGAVAMHRIPMDKGESGAAILDAAGVGYGPAPVVFAIVRGDVYPLTALPGVLFRERQAYIQPMLFDFVASFFVEAPVATTPVIATIDALEDAVSSHLALRESTSAAYGILMVSDQVDLGLCLSLAAQSPHTSVVVVHHAVLTFLLRNVCRMSDAAPEARHMLVLLPTASPTLRQAATGGGRSTGTSAWCPFLRVAASQSPLSPSRALQFVAKHHQVTIRASPTSAGQHGAGAERTLTLLDSTTYWHACAERCVVLLMAQCSNAQEAGSPNRRHGSDLGDMLKEYINKGATVATAVHASDLLEDLSPFQSLFVCLDAEPALAALLLAAIARRTPVGRPSSINAVTQLDGGFLVLQSTPTQYDSTKQQVLFIPPNAGSASGLFSNLQGLLADIMEGAEASYRAFLLPLAVGDSSDIIHEVLLAHQLPLSWWRQLRWKLSALFDAASGLFSLLPLVAIWYAFRWCSKPRKPAEGRAPPPAPPHARHRGHTNAAPGAASSKHDPAGGASSEGAGKSPLYHVPYLSSADIKAALDGKGFLILIFHSRVECLPGPLPMSLVGDARFSIRVVEDHHKKWWRWLDDVLTATGRRTSAHDTGPHFIAIRRGRMLAHLKPAHTTVAVWASELLDGSCVPSVVLPQ